MHLEKRFKLREMNVRHHTCNGNKNLHKLVLTATKGSATLYLAGQQAHLNQSYRLPSILNSKKPRPFKFLLAFWCTVVYADLMEDFECLHISKPLKSHYSISTNHRTTDQSKCRRYEFPLDQKINGLGLSLCSGIVIQMCMQASPTLHMP